MAIDRIGKGGVPPVAPKEATGVERSAGAEKTFEVRSERAAQAPSSGAVQPTGATPLERLRAGEIDVDGYVDLKVDEATSHLHGLPADQVESIRATLREQVATDPALAELVQQATGHAPTPRG